MKLTIHKRNDIDIMTVKEVFQMMNPPALRAVKDDKSIVDIPFQDFDFFEVSS